jgi:hypothetical protein
MSETEDMVGELYQQQNNAYYKAGVKFERERIINLLLDLNVIRRAEQDRLVAFDTNGEKVIYLTGFETNEIVSDPKEPGCLCCAGDSCGGDVELGKDE